MLQRHMVREDILARLWENEAELRARGIVHAALFGSRARGEARADSDTDIMIEVDPAAHVTLFDYVGLKEYISPACLMGRSMSWTAKGSSPTCGPQPQPTPSMLSESAKGALRDIACHIDLAAHFTNGLDFATFQDDQRTVYAVTRCLEIISEASRRLPDGMKARHPSITWKNMAGAGNVYRHNYEGCRRNPGLGSRAACLTAPGRCRSARADFRHSMNEGYARTYSI